ncbi:MAG: hydrogenase expression/formation protein HypE [bacterium]|nr:hydrogenase expression/formation protein HypE [bacterium]
MKRAFDRVLLAHGSGGRLTRELIEDSIFPALENQFLKPLSDSAILPELPAGRPAMTTDAFVVDPPIFPGGNLGHLSICGTVNDLAVAGARPLWLTWALILEEGADAELINACLQGAREAASAAGISVVAGDTKVVPKGRGDGIYAVSAGLGVIPPGLQLSDDLIEEGDVIIASGPLGDHGATIMAARHGLESNDLQSDSAPVNHLTEALVGSGIDVHAMHDPTRGGVTAVCNEVAERSGKRIVLKESSIPVRPQVRAACELLGLDPLSLACEGRFLAWVAAKDATRSLEVLQGYESAQGAAVVGSVAARDVQQAPVVLETTIGGERPLDLLSGSELPRIC